MIKSSIVGRDHKVLFIILVLFLGAVFQSWKLAKNVTQDLGEVWRDKGQSALWRSARYSQGYRFAGFVQFLLTNIPEDGLVILPSGEDAPRALSTSPYMQFYLVPRKVINCPNEECYQRLLTSSPYLLIVSKNEESALQKFTGERVMYDQGWGLLIPDHASLNVGTSPLGFNTILELLQAGLLPGIWLILILTSGYLMVERFVPGWNRIERIALGFGIALGVLSLLAALISIARMPLNTVTCWAQSLLLFLMAVLFGFLGRRFKPPRISNGRDRPGIIDTPFWQWVFIGLGLVAAFISIGKGYYSTDAIQTWGVKGYAIAAEGAIRQVASWGTNPWAYPLNIPILVAIFKCLFGEVLPASKIIFSGYYICFLLIAYHFLRQEIGRATIAGLATFLIGTTPIIFRHGTIGYANLPFDYYLIIAILFLNWAIKPESGIQSDQPYLFAGIFFALAMWTRPEGIALSLLAIGIFFGMTFLLQKRFNLRGLIKTILPIIAYLIFWELLEHIVYSQPVTNAGMTSKALRTLISTGFRVEESKYLLLTFLSYIFGFDRWGAVGTVLIILLIVWLLYVKRWQYSSIQLIACGILFILAVLSAYYLTLYSESSGYDLSRWVSTGLDRALMPGILLLWFGFTSGVGSMSQQRMNN
jgi:hypothetical protein